MSVYQKIVNTLVAFGFALIAFYILTVGYEIRSLENRISTIEKEQVDKSDLVVFCSIKCSTDAKEFI